MAQRKKTLLQQFRDHAPLQQNQTSGELNVPSVGSVVHLEHKKGEQKQVGQVSNPKAKTASGKADREPSLGTAGNLPGMRPGAPTRGLHWRGLPEAEHDSAIDRDRGAPWGRNGASGWRHDGRVRGEETPWPRQGPPLGSGHRVHSVGSWQQPAEQSPDPAGEPQPLHVQNELVKVDLP